MIMNYHCMAPKRYKRSVVSEFVYRIYRACSDWTRFHISLQRAKKVLERNQYPPAFYEPIIEQAINNILSSSDETATETPASETSTSERPASETPENSPSVPKKPLFIQYLGKASEDFARALHSIDAPCNTVFTMRKLKSVLPSLKPEIEKKWRGSVVYKLNCSQCRLICFFHVYMYI